MYRYMAGIALLASFVFGITAAAIMDDSQEEMRLDIALCTLVFGASGALLCHSGWQALKSEKIILKMSFDMLEVHGYIDVNKLSLLTETPQKQILQFLKKAQIDNYIKRETSLCLTNQWR